MDLIAFSCSALVAFELRFDGILPVQFLRPMWMAMCIWAALQSAAFIACEVSWDHWRHTSIYEGARIFVANSAGAILGGVVLSVLLRPWGIPRSIYILDWLMANLLTLGGRLTVRVAVTARIFNRIDRELTRMFIYGAGAAGSALVLELRQNKTLECDVIGLIDDDSRKANLCLLGSG